MDAILADPVRGPRIAAIDFHHWFYRPDGSLYTIEGGINEAPREQGVRILPEAQVAALRAQSTYPGNIVNSPEFIRAAQAVRTGTPAMRYRALREYRDAFPDLVILRRGEDPFPGLTAAIEKAIHHSFRVGMRPAARVRTPQATAWCMARLNQNAELLVYSMTGDALELDLTSVPGTFAVTWVDESTQGLGNVVTGLKGGGVATLSRPDAVAKGPWVAWLQQTVTDLIP
ncbi:MAG: hypothetical protein HYZ54_02285 [Ignavibacteriae bacterium]|nr:hypothetical protein [Ignavibacteriota bacterium]